MILLPGLFTTACDNESPARATPSLVSIAVASPPTKTTYTTGEAFTSAGLTVSATYDNASTVTVTDYTLSWNGAALAEGNTAITAGTGTKPVVIAYGGQTTGFSLTVNPANLTLVSIAVANPPAKTLYAEDEAFSSAGLVVRATYDDDSSAPVTGYTLRWNGATLAENSTAITATTGTKPVVVAYEDQTAGFDITVIGSDLTLVSIAVASPPAKTTYAEGEAFSSAGLVVSATYSDGSAGNVTGYTLSWNGAALAENSTAITAATGPQTVAIAYGGQTTSFDISVSEANLTLTAIAVASPPTKITYTQGEAFTSAGLVVSATYSDSNTENVTGYTLSWNGAALAENSTAITAATGTKSVTVAYEGQTTGFDISVNTGSQPPTGEVTGLTAIPGDKTITLTWTNPADEDFDHVEITFTPTAGGISQPITVTGAQIRSVTGLANGTAYTFTVKTVDTMGNKSQGETASATPVDISTGTSFTIAGTEDWTNALALISSDSDGTGSAPKVYNLDIQGTVSVPGAGSSENSINGNYKIVRLTGTGTLSLSDSGSIFHIGNSSQTLIIDGPTLNNTQAISLEKLEDGNNNVALVYVEDGMMELRNGAISGNLPSFTHGGGVYVGNGTFTMSGGTISGNAAVSFSSSSYGGGVYVGNGTFTMLGGTISDNGAYTDNFLSPVSSAYTYGGGVYVGNGTFTMLGGTISGNVSSSFSSAYGGGVSVAGGSFIMSDGEISGNSTSSTTFSTTGGGGVYIDENGRFEMTSGKISGNETAYGGGVAVSRGNFTMEGGEISGNEAEYDGGGVRGPFTMRGGKISGNSAGRDGGGIVGRETFTMLGGTISGNSAGRGGGAYISNCSFTMSGGEISGNSAGRGGGVFVYNGNFSKTGGSIIYGFDETGIDEEGNDLKNTADSGDAYGNTVYYMLYNNGVSTYYYRDTTLNAGDNISTDNLNSGWDQ